MGSLCSGGATSSVLPTAVKLRLALCMLWRDSSPMPFFLPPDAGWMPRSILRKVPSGTSRDANSFLLA